MPTPIAKHQNEWIPSEANVDYQKEDELTPDKWVKRSPHLIRLTGKHPLNCEPPLTMLYEHGFKTPNELHFVRNHGVVPKIDFHEHRLTVNGLVTRELVFSMEELVSMDMISENVVVSCIGNRRKELNLIKKSRGFNFGAAGVGTAKWTGIPIFKILEMAGIESSCDAQVHFEGSELLPKGAYITSIPLTWCLDPKNKYMLAVKMNDEPLPYDHGYPVRAIFPGLIGGRMIKWLKTITVLEEESLNYYHLNDNRIIPPYIDEDYVTQHPRVLENPEFCTYEFNVQSVIVYPEHHEIIDTRNSEEYTLKGFAHTGGHRWINRVDVTFDKGLSWIQADIIRFEKKLAYKTNFNWVFWNLKVPISDVYNAAEISVRAFDSAWNTQPENRTWNLMGMFNNCWFKIKLKKNDAFRVSCKHPTVAGADGGGWWEEECRKLKSRQTPEHLSLKNFTWDDVNLMKEKKNILVINDLVYDVTTYKEHPGGNDTLLAYNGEDCSEEFNSIHSDSAVDQSNEFIIGKLVSAKKSIKTSNLATIISMDYVNDTDILLQLKPQRNFFSSKCYHLMLKHPEFEVTRPYTPIDYKDDVIYLIIKIYDPVPPKFPNGGQFTQILKRMKVGEEVKVMGPFGELEYLENGHFIGTNGNETKGTAFHMFGAGTGICPVYSWIKTMLKENDRNLKITITHCCENENHALLKDNFSNLISEAGRSFSVNYVYNAVEGFLTHKRMSGIIGNSHQEGDVCFICGPPMFNIMCIKFLKLNGYDGSNIFEF